MKRGPFQHPASGLPFEIELLDRDIDEVAPLLIKLYKQRKRSSRRAKLDPEDIRMLAYGLVVLRVQQKKPLTDPHLDLLEAVLDIADPSPRLSEYLGLPKIRSANWDAFVEAAQHEGREPGIGKEKLAKAHGVDEQTIRRWRAMPQYKNQVAFSRHLSGNISEADRKNLERWRRAGSLVKS
jgi:hypothetical protein